MGTWNFGRDYLTEYSYQIMGMDDDDSSYDDIGVKEEIDNELTKLGMLMIRVSRTVTIYVEFDDTITECGYYDGVRLLPTFLVTSDYDDSKEPKREELIEEEESVYESTRYIPEDIYDMVKGRDYTTYAEVLRGYLAENLIEDIVSKTLPKSEKRIIKYFDKVDKILKSHLTPYSVGWCASKIVEEN